MSSSNQEIKQTASETLHLELKKALKNGDIDKAENLILKGADISHDYQAKDYEGISAIPVNKTIQFQNIFRPLMTQCDAFASQLQKAINSTSWNNFPKHQADELIPFWANFYIDWAVENDSSNTLNASTVTKPVASNTAKTNFFANNKQPADIENESVSSSLDFEQISTESLMRSAPFLK